jgi:hypothetical protein
MISAKTVVMMYVLTMAVRTRVMKRVQITRALIPAAYLKSTI